MTEKKYIVEENIYLGDRFQEFFDSIEEAEAAFDDTIRHRTDRELQNQDITLGVMERTEKYIDEDMLEKDDWWIGYHGYDIIREHRCEKW